MLRIIRPMANAQPVPEALSTHRIQGLQDALFAIVLTLLVLEMRVPEGGGEELIHGLQELWPVYFSYVVTFLNIGVFWVGQHAQFYYIKATDRVLLWINLLFMMFISVLPFTTALLGEHPDEIITYVLYGLNLMVVGLFSYWHWAYAVHHHRLTNHDLTKATIRAVNFRILVAPFICLIAIAAAYINTSVSLAFYLLLPVYYIRPGKIDEVWRRTAVPHED